MTATKPAPRFLLYDEARRLVHDATAALDRGADLADLSRWRAKLVDTEGRVERRVADQRSAARLVTDMRELRLRLQRRIGESLTRTPEAAEPAGITRRQADRWQLEAAIPPEAFEWFVTASRERGSALTSAALLEWVRMHHTKPRRDHQ